MPSLRKSTTLLNTHVMFLESPSGSVQFPAVLQHCVNCSFTSTFSALRIGIQVDDG